MFTYQDFLNTRERAGIEVAVKTAVQNWKNGDIYRTAKIADCYDRQKNVTLSELNLAKSNAASRIYGKEFNGGSKSELASNFFHRLNTQRCIYLLGNGVTFADEAVKNRLGADFDTKIKELTYKALIHGVCFGFWTEKLNVFEVTEFCPLFDEETGYLMCGIRFWQIDNAKPIFFVVYETDGFTKYRIKNDVFSEVAPKVGYIVKTKYTAADGVEIVGEENYSALPIMPLYSNLRQSTLKGLRPLIDAYDIVNSGFADDLNEMQEIFWILENYDGMMQSDLIKFFRRLKWFKVAEIDTDGGESKITPYRQEVPYQSRQAFLDSLKKQIYEDFGALDLHEMSAGSTNDHIDAAYQTLDEEADALEYNVIEFIQQLGKLLNIPSENITPQFKRNKISNQSEQVNMLVAEAVWLDEETILKKLPNVSPDEIADILKRRSAEDVDRFMSDENVIESNENVIENTENVSEKN